jgi:hypothetical protein
MTRSLTNVTTTAALLLDRSARIDERDDAAMNLGLSDDVRAVDALLEVGSDPAEAFAILSSCGESLAEIAVRNSRRVRGWLSLLAPPAAHELRASVLAARPELLEER